MDVNAQVVETIWKSGLTWVMQNMGCLEGSHRYCGAQARRGTEVQADLSAKAGHFCLGKCFTTPHVCEDSRAHDGWAEGVGSHTDMYGHPERARG